MSNSMWLWGRNDQTPKNMPAANMLHWIYLYKYKYNDKHEIHTNIYKYYPQTPCVAQTLTLRMSCCRIYDRRDCRKYCVYAVFSSLGFKVFRAQVLGFRVLGFGVLGFGVLGFRMVQGFRVQGSSSGKSQNTGPAQVFEHVEG